MPEHEDYGGNAVTRLFVALENTVLVARRHDGRWRVSAELEHTRPQCLAIDPHDPQRVYCGTFDQGLWRSTDAGTTWQALDAGITHDRVVAVAVDPDERSDTYSTVYAGTEPSDVFRSDDGGDSWHRCLGLNELPSSSRWSFPPRPHTHHVRWIAADPNAAGRIYVAIEAGALVHSPDGGATWKDRTPKGPYDTHTLVTHEQAAGRLYVAAGDGYYESTDSGKSWKKPREGLRHGYCWSVAVDPGDSETVVVSAAAGAYSAHNVQRAETYIYRKPANSAWQQVHAGLPDPHGTSRSVLATERGSAGVFYAANNHGVFRSEDTGRTWHQLDISWPDSSREANAEALFIIPE